MITLNNTQRTISLNTSQIKHDAQKILDLLEYSDYDLGIWFCSDQTIRTYNKNYRGKDKVTDILSFPYHTDLKAGQRIQPKIPEDKNLGDLIIAPRHVTKDARNLGILFDERLRILLVHGICHLLGYDHIKDKDYAIMKKQEEFLNAALKKSKD